MSWIEKTKSGTLRLCERVKVDGSWKRLSVPIEKDTAQARRRATEALEQKARAICTPITEMRLNEAIERYLARDGIRESTRIYEGSALRSAMDMIGNERMCDLTAPLIKRKMMETGLPPQKLNGKLRYVKSMLRWCLEYGYIEDDFVGRLRSFPVKNKEQDPADLYLEQDELQDILDHLSGMRYYIVKFLALTGCRVGEMSALQVSDIGDRYISITKSYNQASRTITEPKSVTSARDIFIQPELAELLKEYKEWRLIYMMSEGIRTELLFFSPSGGIYSENTLYRALRRIGPKLHPHILRHTHVALLADQGVPLEAISRRLGHSDSGITKKVYYHVTKKQKQKDEEKLSLIRIL